MMDKTELLFLMMEQPEKYDDEQWRAILSDKDCRELYATMSLTKSALDAQHGDGGRGYRQLDHHVLCGYPGAVHGEP